MHPCRTVSSNIRRICTASFLSIAMLVALAAPALGQDGERPTVRRGAELIDVVTPTVFDGDLRDLPRAPGWQPGDPIKEIPRRHTRQVKPPGAPANPTGLTRDPLLEVQEGAVASRSTRVFSTPDVNIAGQGFSGVNPPDTVGDVGTDYYIQMINGSAATTFVVYNKSNGSVAAGPIDLDSLATTNFCGNGLGDPIVNYDDLAGRWVLSEFSSSGNRLCVYVSQTGDPITGGWYAYDFAATNFPDYPKYGVWPDAYYVGTNENNVAAYAMERLQMLNGLAAGLQRFTAPDLSGFGFQMITPADVDGTTPPPGGSPAYFLRHNDDESHNPGSNNPSADFLEIFEFSVDWANAANSTFTGPTQIPVAEFDSDLCGLVSFNCIAQPGTSTQLDPLREVTMWRNQYRNFGSHGVIVGNYATDVSGSDDSGVRWFELRDTGSGWTLFQEGTYAPDSDSRFMGSAAMDSSGNIAVGYNVSSGSTFPSLRYAGRLAGDPVGTLPQGENNLVSGSASNASNRYGDYSSLNVDPVDGCTMWFTGEYNTASQWSTRIGSFAFDACGSVCGNGVQEPGEDCDGADLGSGTCQGLGCDPGGALSCNVDCTYDTSGCSNCPQCDFDGVCELGEDCNGCTDCPSGTTSGAVCGNGVCEAGNGEDCVSCAADCNGTQGGKPSNRFCCGDGDGQNPVTCSDSRCSTGGVTCTDVPVVPGSFCCGLFGCEPGEDCSNCALDCTLGAELCSGGVDEDCDGFVDCDDSECTNQPPFCDCTDVGQSCQNDADCCSGDCSGGKPSTRVCLP